MVDRVEAAPAIAALHTGWPAALNHYVARRPSAVHWDHQVSQMPFDHRSVCRRVAGDLDSMVAMIPACRPETDGKRQKLSFRLAVVRPRRASRA